MTIQHSPDTQEEGIDLRKGIDSLIRNWWLILAAVVVSAVIAGIISYGFQASTYLSSAGGILPSANGDNGVGLSPPGYREFASSTRVLEAVAGELDLELSAGQLRNQFTFQVDECDFLTTTASAPTAEEAFRLAASWLEVYDREVQSLLQDQFGLIKTRSTREFELLEPQLDEAEDRLARFNLETPPGKMESQLANSEAELSESEKQLEELTKFTIPDDEARLTAMLNAYDSESGAIGGGGSPVGSLAGDALRPELVTSSAAYFELSRNLTRSQLDTVEQELVNSESRLRSLTQNSIPVTEVKVESLEKALASEPPVLAASVFAGNPDNIPLVNPVYLKLSQGLWDARTTLDTERKEAEVLSARISVLQDQSISLRFDLVLQQREADQLTDQRVFRRELENISTLNSEILQAREAILSARPTRKELEEAVASLSKAFTLAKSQLEQVTLLEPDLAETTRLSALREPAVPTSAASPQRGRNIALSIFLGLLVGVSVALLRDYYKGRLSVAAPMGE